MKKTLLIAALAVVMAGGMAFAANPDSFDISCTVAVTYAVTITTPTGGLTFTNVDVNTTYVSDSSATVKNTGSASADLKIKGTALGTWTLGAAPASNVVRLMGAFKDAATAVEGDFEVANDTITVTAQNMDATHYSIDQNGNNVAKNASHGLWVRLDTPTDTDTTAAQSFKVDVQAFVSSTF